MKELNIAKELIDSGQKFRKELLTVPVATLQKELQYMTLRTGVRGKETVSELEAEAEIAPYKMGGNLIDTGKIEPRTLETFLGRVRTIIDPYTIYTTIWGENLSKDVKDLDIVKAIAIRIAQNCVAGLSKALFTGVRNATGTKTIDLFNGFCTIAQEEITNGTIADAKGNHATIGALTATDVVDKLIEFYQDAADEDLQDCETKLYIPRELYNLYNKGYKETYKCLPYNTEYRKTFLEGTDNSCELVPLRGLKDETMCFLSTKENMLIGVDQMSDAENAGIFPCEDPDAVQFRLKAFFGTQFLSIKKQCLCVGEFTI